MDKLSRLERYIFEFFSARAEDWHDYFRATHRDRQSGIYQLKKGPKLMDFFIAIDSYVQEGFYSERLVPQKYATVNSLLKALSGFKDYLNENQPLLDLNTNGEETSDEIQLLQRIKDELIEMIDHTKEIYDYEDTIIPYLDLRHSLIVGDIDHFISILKSILASVSYAIHKTQEGYFHSNVHLILRLLGFDILAEESTNTGRIDAVIRFSNKIYIVEFKFEGELDASKKALLQIKSNRYAEKYRVERKEIIGIGISFSKKERNINGFEVENL